MESSNKTKKAFSSLFVEVIPRFIHSQKRNRRSAGDFPCVDTCTGITDHPFPSLVLFVCIWFWGGSIIHTHTVSRSSSGGIWFTSCLVLAHLLWAHPFLLYVAFPPPLQLWVLIFFLFSLALWSDLSTQRRETGGGGGGGGGAGGVGWGQGLSSIGRRGCRCSPLSFVPFWLVFFLPCVPVRTLPPFPSGSSGHSPPRWIQRHSQRQCFGIQE